MTYAMTTKTGRPTRYAMACGDGERYVHKTPVTHIEVSIWMEHGSFNVRAHNFTTHVRLTWTGWPTLTEARREFDAVKHAVKTGMIY